MNYQKFVEYIKENVGCGEGTWLSSPSANDQYCQTRSHFAFAEHLRFTMRGSKKNRKLFFNPFIYVPKGRTEMFDGRMGVFEAKAREAFEIAKAFLGEGFTFDKYFKSGDSKDTKGHLYGTLAQLFVPISSDNFDMLSDQEKTEIVRAYEVLVDAEAEIGVKDEDFNKKARGVAKGTKDNQLPRNWIIFGAPGTGKSRFLEDERKKKWGNVIDGGKDNADKPFFDTFERVTFFPTYSYAQFVGTYKPVMNTTNQIAYKFVPGPFLNLLAKALKDSDHNYLIIIEEINRANAAAVFGDMFQLLDRDEDGMSEYDIAVPEDVKKWLDDQKVKASHVDGQDAQDSTVAWNGVKLRIPPNFYIWATMNSADQGVFPLDTAFKRRWDFEYIGVDEATGPNIWIETDSGAYSWAALRRAINDRLLTAGTVNEDKLLGPWFLKGKSGDYISAEKFSSKVLMYLWEDAARMCRKQFFADDIAKFSDLKKNWERAHGLPDASDSTFSEVFQIQSVKNLRFKEKISEKDLNVAQKKNEEGLPAVKDGKPVVEVKFKEVSLDDKKFKVESVEGNPSLVEISIDNDVCYGRIRFNVETGKVEAAQDTLGSTQVNAAEAAFETSAGPEKPE